MIRAFFFRTLEWLWIVEPVFGELLPLNALVFSWNSNSTRAGGLIAGLRLSSRPFDTQKSFCLAPQMKSLHLNKTWIMTSGSKCIPVCFLKFSNTLETLLQSCALLYHYMLVLLCVFLVLSGVEALWEQKLEQFQTNIFSVKFGSVNVLSTKKRRGRSEGGERNLAINSSITAHL
jgi:hypothetical protein